MCALPLLLASTVYLKLYIAFFSYHQWLCDHAMMTVAMAVTSTVMLNAIHEPL